MLKNKLVFMAIAASVLLTYDYTHAFSLKSIVNKMKNSKVVSTVGGDLKNIAASVGQNIKTEYKQNTNGLTGAEEEQTDSVQSVNNAYAAAAAAKGLYEARKQMGSSTDIYNAAVDYNNKARIYEETVRQAEKEAQEKFLNISQQYQSASANLNYMKSLLNGATNFRSEADKALQASQTGAAALPSSIPPQQTTLPTATDPLPITQPAVVQPAVGTN